MMNDKKVLEKIQEQVMAEANSYARFKKENVLKRLLSSINRKTEKLVFPVVIPLYEHDMEFMKQTLNCLGYLPKYEEEYNYYFKTTCCIVSIK